MMKYLLIFLVAGICVSYRADAQSPPETDSQSEAENSTSESENRDDFDLFLEPYNYEPSGRRDPFLRLDQVTKSGPVVSGGQQRPLLPLESFELNSIKLIGIIWDTQNPRAMFLDPTGKVHILTKDQRIGRNQGYIAVIRENEVIVVETSEKNGEPVYNTERMTMARIKK
ncbi:MAG: pilus assembly protein PilP [Bdellovibrionales bacterium]